MPIALPSLAALLTDEPVRALDVGAAGGMPGNWVPYSAYLAVDAFEPDGAECERQRRKGVGPVEWFPVALAGATGKRPFYVLNRSTGSSLFPPNEEVLGQFTPEDYWGIHKVLELDCLSLADFIERYDRPAPEMIKLDTQGAELEILASLRDDHWDAVRFVETEVEFREVYKGQPLFFDVHEFMTEKGFRLLDLRTHRAYHLADGRRNGHLRRELSAGVGSKRLSAQLLAGDALYARPPTDERVVSTSRALAGYVLAALAYRYHDLVFDLLDRPETRGVLSEADRTAWRGDVRRTAPKPRPWERAELPFDLARRVRSRFFPSRNGYQAFWTRRTWPDQ